MVVDGSKKQTYDYCPDSALLAGNLAAEKAKFRSKIWFGLLRL